MNRKISLAEMFPIIFEQLNSGGSASFTIHGTSMLPLLKDGVDTVKIIKPITPPEKYDIIFYRRENGLFILHRIVGIKNGNYICRGDNQTENEYPVTPLSVIGIVTEYTKNGKTRSVSSLRHKVYSIITVNTVILKKAVRKVINLARKVKKALLKESNPE